MSVKVILKVRDGRRRGKRPTGQGSVERDGGLACAEAGHSGPARRGSPPGRRTCGVTRFRAGSRQVSGTGASLPGGSALRVRSSSLYVSLSRENLPFNVHKRCWDDRFISGLGEAPGRAAGTAGVNLTLRAGATVGRGPQRKGQSCGAAPAPRPAPQLAGVVTQLPQLARQAPPLPRQGDRALLWGPYLQEVLGASSQDSGVMQLNRQGPLLCSSVCWFGSG